MRPYGFEYQGVTTFSLGLRITECPDISGGEDDITTYTIPGRDGVLVSDLGRKNPVVIEYTLCQETNPDEWMMSFGEIRKWLCQKPCGRLTMSDLMDRYYKVISVTIESSQREYNRFGSVTVKFVCEPYLYLTEGTVPFANPGLLYNPGSVSKPVYQITGEGVCTLTVNGNNIKANVGQNLTIDTERMIAYRTDGSIRNTSVTGEYEKMCLQEGENKISITAGFELQIIPNWRCL